MATPMSLANRQEATLTLQYRYEPHGTVREPSERAPMVVAWLAGVPHLPGAPPAYHRHPLLPVQGGAAYASVQVEFPYVRAAASAPWSRDACLHTLLMTQVRSSEGQWTYAKSASTETYLADLLAVPAGTQLRTPMRVQSYYMPGREVTPQQLEADRHKGDLVVSHQLTPAQTARVIWGPASGFDLTPTNLPALQAAMMLTVGRSMSPFQSPDGGGNQGTALQPTLHEIHNVHAPLYVQETQVPVDGAKFWQMAPDTAREHVAHHGGPAEADAYLDTLLQQSLARHNINLPDFVQAGRVAAGQLRSGGPADDAALHRAVAVIGTACTMRVNMMRYVADEAVLPASGQVRVVESFDQVDIRTADGSDSGGVRSRDINSGVGGAPATGLGSGPGRDVAVGGAMDCEDGGRDAAVHFALIADPGAGLPDSALRSSLLIAARQVASHYRVVGVLCSVLSRNLADSHASTTSAATTASTGPPPIGSAADARVEVGAHMFALMMPKTALQRNVARALAARGGIGEAAATRVDLGHGPAGEGGSAVAESPLSTGADLPVALLEGTGMLNPLAQAAEAYGRGHGDAERVRWATQAALEQEAQVRMRTGRTSGQMMRAASEATTTTKSRPPGAIASASAELGSGPLAPTPPAAAAALELFVPMHVQEQLVDDDRQRLVPGFYRTAAECFLVPTAAQLAERRARTQARPQYLCGDRLLPVQIGARLPADRLKPGAFTWGAAVSDLIRQREFVGMLPTPEPTPDETAAVDRVQAHLAPAVALHLDNQLLADHYVAKAAQWPKVLAAEGLKPAVSAAAASAAGAVVIHAYTHPRDLKTAQVRELARWLRGNPHVAGASIVLERSTYHLALARLDAAVWVGDVATRLRQPILDMITQTPVRSVGGSDGGKHAANTGTVLAVGRGLRHPRLFEGAMAHHVRLTIAYVKASWRNYRRAGGSDLPLEHPAVQALLGQFGEWVEAIRRQVGPSCARRVVDAAPRLVPNKRFVRAPTAAELWTADLIKDHTVFAKQLADAAWSPARAEEKQRALAGITGANRDRIVLFWSMLMQSEARDERKAVAALWDEHLHCTARYIDTLARTGDPASQEFRRDTADCEAKGRRFGALLDSELGGGCVNVGRY